MLKEDNIYHFHLLVFESGNSEDRLAGTFGTRSRLLSKSRIEEIQRENGLSKKWWLINASYLGKGTPKEFDPTFGMHPHKAYNYKVFRNNKFNRIN